MELLGNFNGGWPYLIAVIIVVIGGALINNGYLSKLLKSRGKGKPMSDLVDHIKEIDGKITTLSCEVAELAKRVGYIDKSAQMANIHNEKLNIVDRLGGNGFVAEYAITELILPHKNEWLREQHEATMDIYCQKYHERIAEIKKRIGIAA